MKTVSRDHGNTGENELGEFANDQKNEGGKGKSGSVVFVLISFKSPLMTCSIYFYLLF